MHALLLRSVGRRSDGRQDGLVKARAKVLPRVRSSPEKARSPVKKLLFLVAFVGSVAVGAACNNALTESCEDFKSARDACELQNGDDPPMYGFDLCDNIDADCEEFYRCASVAACEQKKGDKKWRLQTTAAGCKQPENKECTDADLRP